MSKADLFYTIHNGGDGSASVQFHEDDEMAQLAVDLENEGEPFSENDVHTKTLRFDEAGNLLNPTTPKAELLRELAELRGEDGGEEAEDDEAAAPAPRAAADDSIRRSVEVIYTIHNGGDGSASVQFHEDREAAQLAVDIEDEGGEPFSENYIYSEALNFDAGGKLLNPSYTKEELRRELAERRGEDVEDDMDEEVGEEPAPQGAAPDLAADFNIAGKTVVFTGKLSTMTRKEAETLAQKFGAKAGDSVTKNTDLLVVGEDAGSKLAKAKALGVPVMTEAEWNKATARKAPGP